MKSNGYKEYLKRIKRENILVLTTQIILMAVFFIIWQFLADKKIIDVFLFSSPKNI